MIAQSNGHALGQRRVAPSLTSHYDDRQMTSLTESLWNSHDFKVKMLDWSAARGSRLIHTCRRCGRGFCRFTAVGHGIWAIDDEGRTLETVISDQWLSEACPTITNENDDRDRKRLRDPISQ
jgi:hypothetical protein